MTKASYVSFAKKNKNKMCIPCNHDTPPFSIDTQYIYPHTDTPHRFLDAKR